jgi:uncharacterized protein (DUF433 family)
MATHPEPYDAQITTRIPSRVRHELDELAHAQGTSPLSLARILLDEGVRRERHPGITFRSGEAGRRAALAGHRLDVWQVMETVWASGGNVEEAASYLGLRTDEVEAAAAYYADYPHEVDAFVQRNRELAAREEDAWRRRRAALRR